MVKYELNKKAVIQMGITVKSVNKELGTLEAIFSTQDTDRHGDIVIQAGWDLTNFNLNPVILNSHNYGDATEVIGKASNIRLEDEKLVGTITFAIKENPKAKVIFDLYAGGFLNAFSVGFIPREFKKNNDGTTDWSVIIKAELLEVSAVSVPANARALAKAKGIEVEVLPTTNDTNNDENQPNSNAETSADEPEPTDDQGGENSQVPTANGDEPTQQGDNGQDEPEAGDETNQGGGGDSESPAVIPEPDSEPEREKTYLQKVAGALDRIEAKRQEQYTQVAKVVNSLLTPNQKGNTLDSNNRRLIEKRKVNKAIRMLLDAKK